MSTHKVYVIDSSITSRSRPLFDQLRLNSNFETERIEATMIDSFNSNDLKKIEFSDGEFKRKSNRSFLPGEIGCANSHNLARLKAFSEIDGALILEDDARISNSEKLVLQIEKFNLLIEDEVAVLSLTSFLTTGMSVCDVDSSDTRFLRLKGEPPLAVAYYLRPKAALLLREANSPIKSVADWPSAEVNYYVSNASYITHGDSTTKSTIENSNDYGEAGIRRTYTGFSRFSKLIFKSLFLKRDLEYVRMKISKSLVYRLDKFRVRRSFGNCP